MDELDSGLLEQLDQDAYTTACERMSPNAPGFDQLCERLYEELCAEARGK